MSAWVYPDHPGFCPTEVHGLGPVEVSRDDRLYVRRRRIIHCSCSVQLSAGNYPPPPSMRLSASPRDLGINPPAWPSQNWPQFPRCRAFAVDAQVIAVAFSRSCGGTRSFCSITCILIVVNIALPERVSFNIYPDLQQCSSPVNPGKILLDYRKPVFISFVVGSKRAVSCAPNVKLLLTCDDKLSACSRTR